MSQSNISKQAEKYAEVIVGQIADNFQQLNDNVASCIKLKETLDEYKKAHNQSKWAKFIFEKNIDEYIGYVDEAKKETGCEDYNRIEPLAVGLFGEWGSGKTHQLKLIKHNILYPPKDIKFPQTTIPVFFNAWRFEKEEHIILPLFQTLLQAVEEYEFSLEEKGAKGYRTLSMYLKLGLLSLNKGLKVPDFISATKYFDKGEYKKAIDEIIDTSKISTNILKKIKNSIVGEQTLTELLQEDQLESIYLNIPQWIEKITLFENVNFVFLIDDLDRCLPENTLKMLESIKLFLDVPSCAFVLAVDDDMVERGVVHHYRDYLSIYHHKDTEGSQSVMQHELPITGHEYLEKMIQLPIRLPVIDTVNVRKFLEECSQGWIELIDKKDNPEGLRTTTTPIRMDEQLDLKEEFYNSPADKLLDYLSDAIPPKPRKIKRTAKLFESKIQLLHGMGLADKCSYELLAKITLLELFAPKILRFIQNNDYAETYRALYDFHYVNDKDETAEKVKNTLYDTEDIKSYINANDDYTQEKKDRYEKLITMIGEHHSSRMVFDLGTVFSQREEYESLKVAIEYRESSRLDAKIQVSSGVLSEEMMNQLFLEDNPETWGATLREYKEIITSKQLDELIKKAKNKKDRKFNNLPFIANPEWVGQVASFVDADSYIVLLKASHDERFKIFESIEDGYSSYIDSFQLTFAEYYKYCELNNIAKKPIDEGWGRGRRPVVNVSWNDTQKYIKWLNKINTKYKYALPTKAQWELACNLGKGTNWYFGDDESKLKKYAWYKENSGGKTHPVGMLEPNEKNLYDMHGNVWELCENGNAGDKLKKFLKGGSWGDNSHFLHTVTKKDESISLDNNASIIGFRLLRTLR